MTQARMALPRRVANGSTKKLGTLEIVRQLRGSRLLELIMDLWRDQGDLPRLRIGGMDVFVVIHPEHVRHVSITARQGFDKFASYDTSRRLLLGDGLIASNGALWKRQRRLMASTFSPRAVEQYCPVMVSAAEAAARRWEPIARRGEPVQMVDEMMLVTAWIIVQSMFGIDVGDGRLDALKGDVEHLIGFVTKRGMTALRPPMWLPFPSHFQYRAARTRVDDLVNDLIAKRRARPPSEWPDDLLSKLMLARDEDTGEAMTDRLVRDESLGIFIAGHETTARTMSFLWLSLHENPDVEARMHAELDAVLAQDEAPTLAHLKRLPYTLQVIKEVLRLYPAAPFFARDSAFDQTMDGVDIPKGAVMMLAPYATHRHPDFWAEPECFDPDRWLPEREAARHPFAYHPFAAGHRICLGNSFALLEAHILAAVLVRRFKARMIAGHKPRLESAGTLIIPNGIPMMLTSR